MMASRNSRHDRDGVADAALDLLDQVGLPDLTMRRLATELDVQPSALYWHFASKQELLAAVADRIIARIPHPASSADDLPVRLHRTAHAIRDALLAYRDGAEVVLSSTALRLGDNRAHQAIVEALGETADETHRRETAWAVLQFILGHTTLIQQRMHAESHGVHVTPAEDRAQEQSDASARVFDTAIALFAAGLGTSAPSALHERG